MGHRFLGALTRGPYRKFSGSRPPSRLRNRGLALPVLALLAALAVGVLFLLPGGPLHAQEAATELEYAENGTDPVATFTAVDPEGRTVYWDVLAANATFADIDDVEQADAADADDFSISMDGVLNFKFPPSFESPMGGTTNTNTYKVVVVSSDDAPGATTDGMAPATDGSNLPKMAYHKVTVMVTDEDEDGSISLSALQPQAGVALTATLTDQDSRRNADNNIATNPITNASWKWEQSPAMDGPWTLIPGAGATAIAATGITSDTKARVPYTPAEETAGMYLRATVTYTDKHGDDKTAMAVSANMVRVQPAGQNASPVFPGTTTTREMDENLPPGTEVGKPVTAGDAGDILTYSLSGTDITHFAIDRATGQITVKTKLNYEATTDQCDTANSCSVTVTATDPWGIETPDATQSAAREVIITINDVNEAPRITGGATKARVAENTLIATPVSTYTAYPEVSTPACAADTCTWSLTGTDAGDFEVSEEAGSGSNLTFKKVPNFENPADADGDNVYMVTVKVTDTGTPKMSATRDVMITVTNDDDPGEITFSSVQPRVRIPFTATLTDDDDVVGDVKWRWYTANPDGDDDGQVNDDATPIAKAKSDTFTPKDNHADPNNNGNDEDGVTLYVSAEYTDSDGSGKTALGSSNNPVELNRQNEAPEFKVNDKVVTAMSRSIEENSPDPDANPPKTSNVGLPVAARDPNATYTPEGTTIDAEGRLTYTLDGRDKDSFDIVPGTGQITVKDDTELDYEKKKSYMVTVTATDPSQASATIDVTINVTNEDEVPVIAGEDVKKDYAENGTGQVARFTAKDPEGRKVYWSLDDDDTTQSPDYMDFEISANGELSFSPAPDFDNRADADTNNIYVVRVVASDDAPGADGDAKSVSGKTSMKKATITVTDRDEGGTLTLSPRFPDAGDALTATLADEDATSDQIAGATWKWYVKGDLVDGAITSSHTPADDATGSVRVTASYRDGHGDTPKMLSEIVTVIALVTGNNAPEFAEGANTTRKVAENRHPATVGSPVRATDSDSTHSGKLVYSVPDNDNFTVDPTSGQLRTKKALDHETATTDGTESVTITVTDPVGGTDSIPVIVTISDVNEDPTITDGSTMKMLNEDDVDTEAGDAESKVVDTYTAEDPESTGVDGACDAASCTWSLRGTDAADFTIGDGDEGTTFGALMFKEFPNYEMPADSNKDNVYTVTVVLTDNGRKTATRDVTVMVMDVEEDGKVTVTPVQPKVDVAVTAELKDPDGGEASVEWQWARTDLGDATTAIATCPAADASTGWTDIPDAEMTTYTPVTADLGKCVRATAKYADRRDDGKDAVVASNNPVIVNHDNRAPVFKDANDKEITETTRKVREDAKENAAEDNSNTDGVDERMQVGNPVMATDPNTEDNLTYKLTGADAALFKIGSADIEATAELDDRGLISLKADTELDYEDRNRYMVTVTATDPNGLSDSVDVTIKVTDVDEAPDIMVGGLAISSGPVNTDHPEDSTADVGTYTVVGAMKDSASWTLTGNDASHFMLHPDPATGMSVMLMFKTAPDHEMPGDANMDNYYMVTLNAVDSEGNMAMSQVTVRVTNMDDDGMVTFWRDGADATAAAIVVGDEITAAVMDPDGNPGDPFPIAMDTTIASANWQWAKHAMPGDGSMPADDSTGWMNIGTDAAYTVVAADEGYYLRAMATYADGHGSGKMAMMTTTGAVTAVMDMPGTVTLSTMQPRAGTAITAMLMDADVPVAGSVTWQWSSSDAMDGTFTDIDGATMASYTPRDAMEDDPATTDMDEMYAGDVGMYLMATATYNDGHGTGKTEMATTTGMVMVIADLPGMVTLSSMTPVVGGELTAMLEDDDGMVSGEMWRWSKSMTMDGTFMNIDGATMMTYTPVEMDEGYHLRATVTYTDGHGPGKTEMATTTSMVTTGDPVVIRFGGDDGMIDRVDVVAAIRAYLFGGGDLGTVTRGDVIGVIRVFLASN